MRPRRITPSRSGTYFNPRTPCGVRPEGTRDNSKTVEISIHAPLAGCDCSGGLVLPFCSLFQSTHPLRGATIGVTSLFTGVLFQSTHPLRGATKFWSACVPSNIFQSTHPLRGATTMYRSSAACMEISIHAPLAGCDTDMLDEAEIRKISIHAPLAGCDSKITEIFTANLRKSYKISAKPNKERRCRVLGKGKAAAISDLARCEPPGENRNASGSHQTISAPSGS